jgi:hypothetical protein
VISSPAAASDPVVIIVTLESESTIDFDLYVYKGADVNQVECSKAYTNSTLPGTAVDKASLQWGKSNGDDDRTLSIEVRPKNPNDCKPSSGAKNWSLLVEGYKS